MTVPADTSLQVSCSFFTRRDSPFSFRSFVCGVRRCKDWFRQVLSQLRISATLFMFELSLLTFGTVLALSLVMSVIRPQKEGDPFYI